MTGRAALVTGATGFLGARLVPALLEDGWSVRATGRRRRPDRLAAEADYRPADLAGDDDLTGLFDGVTHLFHLAGASSSRSSEAEMHRSNVVGTERLLNAAPPVLERVVHMSSTSVYGEEEQLPSPVPEDVQPRPSRGYGKAKWQAEQVVWAHGGRLPVVVLRPVSVYGPGNVKLLASAVLDVAVEAFAGYGTLPVPTRPVEQRLVHVDDLLRATRHVATTDAAVGRAFNVVADDYPSSHTVARLLADAFGMDVALEDDPDCGPGRDERARTHAAMVARGMVPEIILTPERFRFMRKANRNNRLSTDALLGTGFRFVQTDLAAGVAATIGWYRDHRWLP